MTCLIIDDEILAQDVIEHYVSRTDSLQLMGKCNNALEAFSFLSKQEVDLIFLDIQMPEINGLEFIKILKHPPKIILTTAYTEYALDGYELNVVDYLLKPISLDRFLKAIDKVKISLQSGMPEKEPAAKASDDIFVKSNGKLIRISTAEIRYVEGLKNYLLIHIGQKKIITHCTMTNMEEELAPFNNFIRIHKSYLINKNYISEIAGNIVKIEQAELPVGAVYRANMLKFIKVI